jgi:hypothetical protein
MKLYATVTSDKGGREAGKGGDNRIMTQYYNGNIPVFEVTFLDDGERRGYLEVMSYMYGSERIHVIPYDIGKSDNEKRTA